MQTIRTISGMKRLVRKLSGQGKKVALVPTMGYLHEGHLSLITRARREADVVIVSIFVNPTQFGTGDDLEKYPRDVKGDSRKVKRAGCDILFIPGAAEMYPGGFDSWVEVGGFSDGLEAASRPGHFRGVTTVVAKLFNITRPDVAIFGMKDYQQAIVLKRMTIDLSYPIKFVIGPTVRHSDGLAMSSRNAYFDERARWEAVCLYFALRSAREMVRAGILDTNKIAREMRAIIISTCPGAKIDYIAFTDFESLKVVKRVVKNCICSLAVIVHKVRLIDNMKLLIR